MPYADPDTRILHRVWFAMRERCSDPSHPAYPDYGGRGIRVCERWSSFEAFAEDVGKRPSHELTLDRVDNDGNYEPGNVRWATRKEQARNRRSTVRIEFRGRVQMIDEWAAEIGISANLLAWRVRAWGVERALTTPKLFDGEWLAKARANGVPDAAFYKRLERGWDPERAVTLPVRKLRPRASRAASLPA